MNSNVSGTKRDVAPKQRYDRFSSARDSIRVTPTSEHAWTTQKHTVIGRLMSSIRFTDIQTVILKDFFLFINFTFVTEK